MPVEFSQASEYAKERCKHEALHTQFGPPGRPYEYRPYPAMLYRVTRATGTGVPVFEPKIAQDDAERARLAAEGFVAGGQGVALEAFEAMETEHAKLAAELNYEAQHKVSARAAQEIATAQATFGARHLPTIPETPIPAHHKKPGRPPKRAAPVVAEA